MNTPNIRFKGYADDWEQRKFQWLVDESIIDIPMDGNHGEKHPTVADYVESGIPFLMASDIHNGSVDLRKCKFISEERASKLDKGFAKNGDVLITHKATIGEVAILKDLQTPYAMLTPQVTYYRIKDNNRLGKKYLYAWFNSDVFQNEIKSKAAQSTRAYIGISAQRELTIQMPSSIDEQEAVGNLIYNLDNLITLHRRKCDDLQEVKKYILQKLFPQNGAKIPEIRFAGFTGEWEQRKLGDVFQEYSEKRHEELPPLTIIQGGGTILREESDRNLQYDKSSLSNYKMVKKDDFIVHLRSFEGGLEKANSDGIISPAYHTLHGENTDSRFYYPFFRSREFIEVLLKPHVYGIRDGKSIDIEGMKTINIPVPSLEEQQRIGEYIEQMDNLISLQQNRCDNLKEVKKFMLQNMFPRREASPMGED